MATHTIIRAGAAAGKPGEIPDGGNGPHLALVDGSGFIFRAFHALPPMTRPDGTPVNAVFGFCNMIVKLLREQAADAPTHIGVVFDAGRVTFRNRISADYKAHRPDPPDDLIPQFALVRDATEAFGLPPIELEDWEADDLIATYARVAREGGGRVTIVSSDKDLMQLIGPGVGMLDPIKGRTIGEGEVVEKFGVTPGKMIEAQALMGDPVDNVPGVPGIGPKNAAELVNAYGDLESILAAAPAMKPGKRRDMLIAHAEAARLSRALVTLRDDAPLPLPLEALAAREPDRTRLGPWLMFMGFRSIAGRLGLGEAASTTAEIADAATTPQPANAPARTQDSLKAPFGPYEIVGTAAALASFIESVVEAGVVAIGAEPDRADSRQARLAGIALATAPGRSVYVPIGHAELRDQVSVEDACAIISPMLADPGVLKLMHDAKSVIHCLRRAGFGPVTPMDDTMLIAYALEAGAHDFGLHELASLHLGRAPITLDAATGSGRARLAFGDVAVERAAEYAAGAADAVARLWQALRPRLRTEGALAEYERVDRRLLPILLDMESAGVKIDADDLRRMSVDFAGRMAATEREVFALAGHDFNLGSPKALGEVLFDELGLGVGRRMKTGAWGTDASVLQALADQGHDIAAKVLDWRQLAKLKTTYADALVDEIDPRTGRVHTRFAQALTTTGRISSNDPNLQNIPIRTEEGARIRRAFIAEPGHVLVSCDYSQIELRLLAHVADVDVLRESFAAGEDIHARTASEVFGVAMKGMDPATRRRAKAINFGIIYGISPFGLGRQLGIGAGEARGYIDAYFARYPGIRAYMERTKEDARINGYVTTPLGRRCWIAGIRDRNPARRGYAERQAINAPLQGGAADVIKRAMVRLPAAMRAAGFRARLLLQVHDELLFEAPEDEAETLAAEAKRVMEEAARLSVPLVVETGIGLNWAEAH